MTLTIPPPRLAMRPPHSNLPPLRILPAPVLVAALAISCSPAVVYEPQTTSWPEGYDFDQLVPTTAPAADNILECLISEVLSENDHRLALPMRSCDLGIYGMEYWSELGVAMPSKQPFDEIGWPDSTLTLGLAGVSNWTVGASNRRTVLISRVLESRDSYYVLITVSTVRNLLLTSTSTLFRLVVQEGSYRVVGRVPVILKDRALVPIMIPALST